MDNRDIHDVVKDIEFGIDPFNGKKINVVLAGFPCQAFSIAGYRKSGTYITFIFSNINSPPLINRIPFCNIWFNFTISSKTFLGIIICFGNSENC